MPRARLMNTPEDYASLGVQRGEIETWEDQQRNDTKPGHWEWWYFDAILDDGTAVVIQFFTKALSGLDKDGAQPSLAMKVTRPDGSHYERQIDCAAGSSHIGTGKADLRFGPHCFIGDLVDYRIKVDPSDGPKAGLGADLRLHSLASPWRPGTAYFGFGDHDEETFTWLCAVPRGEVSGTLTIDGKTIEVRGSGYHDHQWGSNIYFKLWNHWTWARQRYDDYTVVLFDLNARAEYGRKRFPLFFIQDKDGNVIFESTSDVDCEVLEEYRNAEQGKDYPKIARYRFEHGTKKIQYTLTVERVIESTSLIDVNLKMLKTKLGPFYAVVGGLARRVARRKATKLGLQSATYSRYLANGEMVLDDGGQTITRSDQLIYEFMYPGATYKEEPK
ncbi:lipocalin-like domain-containing protein [Mycolicibacterium peregrinum]|uniref:lipocalin-like domain-containing protein n=1 Tax=Mycolicibacterium TaxID=1866885 RepID=UPI003AAA8F25